MSAATHLVETLDAPSCLVPGPKNILSGGSGPESSSPSSPGTYPKSHWQIDMMTAQARRGLQDCKFTTEFLRDFSEKVENCRIFEETWRKRLFDVCAFILQSPPL